MGMGMGMGMLNRCDIINEHLILFVQDIPQRIVCLSSCLLRDEGVSDDGYHCFAVFIPRLQRWHRFRTKELDMAGQWIDALRDAMVDSPSPSPTPSTIPVTMPISTTVVIAIPFTISIPISMPIPIFMLTPSPSPSPSPCSPPFPSPCPCCVL